MRFKPGVKIYGLRSEMWAAMMVAQSVYDDLGVEFVVTSSADGRHSIKSKHYCGSAIDIRTREMSESKAEKAKDLISTWLTDEFDVIHESNHIHIEYDPKRSS